MSSERVLQCADISSVHSIVPKSVSQAVSQAAKLFIWAWLYLTGLSGEYFNTEILEYFSYDKQEVIYP